MKFQLTLSVFDDDGTNIMVAQLQQNGESIAKLLNRFFVMMSAFDDDIPCSALTAISAHNKTFETLACVMDLWDGIEPIHEIVDIHVDHERLNEMMDRDELLTELAICGAITAPELPDLDGEDDDE